MIASCGDPERVTTLRSSAKPFQVEPLIASGGYDALGLDDRILAVMCASHAGEDMHVEAVRRGLAACGLGPEALQNERSTPEETGRSIVERPEEVLHDEVADCAPLRFAVDDRLPRVDADHHA